MEAPNNSLEYQNFTREELINLIEQKDTLIKDIKEKLKNNQGFVKCSPEFKPEKEFGSGNNYLDCNSVKRYSRQLILPEFRPQGQNKLISSSALIVGCGGLGCPSAIYLAAAGIGKLGLLDFDTIEISNLHRQILHSEFELGESKVSSVIKAVHQLNSNVLCIPHIVQASSKNIMNIIVSYDIVLDCTDNVSTRYLLNDACVLSHKTLISGSALRFEGQLTVYIYQGGPCYRCIFPKPPPPETVTTCSDGGVLGAVPGVIGCLQSIEAIKILCDMGDVCCKKMVIFDALSMSFQCIKLRGRQTHCAVCSDSPQITALIDYEPACILTGTLDNIHVLDANKRITVEHYKSLIDCHRSHLLVDVRSPVELEICKLPNSINVPIKEIDNEKTVSLIEKYIIERSPEQVICVCRRGNDSQKAVLVLEKVVSKFNIPVFDIVGGLTEWAKQIDNTFPVY